MKRFFKGKVKLLILFFLALSFTAYAGTDRKSDRVRQKHRSECGKQNGICKSYSQKGYKTAFKYKKFNLKAGRSHR